MKTHIKRSLSLFLSLVMILTSLSVSSEAIADEIQDAKDEKVTNVETLISDFYGNYLSNLYLTKTDDESVAAKAASRAKFDETSKALSDLSSSEKLQLNKAYYAYWLQAVSTDIIRSATNKTPSQTEKNAMAATRLSEIEAVCGDIPKEYKEVITKYEPLGRMSGSNYVLSNKTNYKDNADAQQALDDLIANVKSFTADQLEFSDYVSIYTTSGGYYFGQTNLNEKTGASTLNAIATFLYYENQDLNADGADPSYFSYSKYVKRSGSYKDGYTYDWQSGVTAQDYIDGFSTYEKATS